MDFQAYTDDAIALVMQYAPRLLLAIVVLIVGLWIINRFVKLLGNLMNTRHVDASLQPFLKSLIGIGLKAMLFISVASMIGIETTSFVALIGAAGLAVGFALQGTLANFAGGVLILIFKPYQVGDLIEAQGHVGWVQEIQIFVTIIKTPDTRTVIIPNGVLSNGDITNNSKLGKMRVDLVMGISYDSNIKQAREVLMNVMKNHPKVMQDPAPFVGALRYAIARFILLFVRIVKQKITGMFISMCTKQEKKLWMQQTSLFRSHKWMCICPKHKCYIF